MNRVKQFVVGVVVLSLAAFMSACATVPPEPKVKASVVGQNIESTKPPGRTIVIARPGDAIHLFHGGNKLAKEEFCLNDIVPVYRYFGSRYKKASEVGKVKVTGYISDHFLEGIVVEGNIKNGDVAMKPNSSCMIRLPEPED